jgi:hypothetical protein
MSDRGSVYRLCECGALASFWVQEDDRLPRPICEPCLQRLQRSVVIGEMHRREEIARRERKVARKAQRQARRAARR